jgi:hypothetical protein
MVLVTNNTRIWLAGLAVSLLVFGLVYLAVIQPSTNTANQAIKTGLQQSQQALNQAQRQVSTASSPTGPGAGQAQQQLGSAAKLTSCVAAAGTDPTKLQACQAQYGH